MMNLCTSKVEYEQKGFCLLPDLIPAEECIALGKALYKWRKKEHVTPNHYGILFHNLFLVLPQFADILSQYRLKERAEEIYGSPLILFQDNLIWKPPRVSTAISWHQDYSYWPLDAPKGITMWIALDDCDEENGCLLMASHSHTQGECIPNDFVSDAPAAWATCLPPLQIAPESIHPLIMQQGMISLHHPLCAHTSGTNNSTRHRRGWSLTFIEEGLRWAPTHAPHPYIYQFSIQEGDSLHNLPILLMNK